MSGRWFLSWGGCGYRLCDYGETTAVQRLQFRGFHVFRTTWTRSFLSRLPQGNNWRGVFQLPEFGTGKKVSRQLQNRIKRARFTFEIWRPRTISFVMGHRPIGHCTRGVKMEGLLTRTEVKVSRKDCSGPRPFTGTSFSKEIVTNVLLAKLIFVGLVVLLIPPPVGIVRHF